MSKNDEPFDRNRSGMKKKLKKQSYFARSRSGRKAFSRGSKRSGSGASRSAGKNTGGWTFLFIHHGNESGGQRGTNRREDILDTVIQLKRPNDYKTEEGSVFEVHFDKARGIHEDVAKPFLARMEEDENGILKWSHQTLVKDIAEELGISKTAVYAHRKNAKESGDLNFFNHSTF